MYREPQHCSNLNTNSRFFSKINGNLFFNFLRKTSVQITWILILDKIQLLRWIKHHIVSENTQKLRRRRADEYTGGEMKTNRMRMQISIIRKYTLDARGMLTCILQLTFDR